MWKKIIVDNIISNYSINENGVIRNDTRNTFLSTHEQNGYMHVTLSINKKQRRFRVHRLVAQTFLNNPENKPYVNHKDGNRKNNNVNNLEWVTPAENTQHAVKEGLWGTACKKPVIQYSMDGERLMSFESITDAAKQTGSNPNKITMCCQRQRRSTNDYQWRYADDYQDVQKIKKKWFSGKKVAQYDDDWNLIAEYPTYAAAAKAIGGDEGAISRVCSGKNKRHKGFHWKVVDDIVQDI